MQDVEFTIERDTCSCCSAVVEAHGLAAIRIAVDMVRERLIKEREALSRVEPQQLDQLLQPIFEPAAKQAPSVKGGSSRAGSTLGQGCFRADRFQCHRRRAIGSRWRPVILTRIETSPEDIRGMSVAAGILTAAAE